MKSNFFSAAWLSATALVMLIVLPYFLSTNEKPGFGNWVLGRSLIAEDAERLALARLNLSAGRKAKSSTAYDAALDYLKAGAGLLNEADGAQALLTLADDIEEIKTICACGRKATMQVRLDDAGQRVLHGDQIQIGGNNRYQQVCARCFYQGDSSA